MLVRMLTHITGHRDGVEWPAAGGVVDLPDAEAERLIIAGNAEPADGDTAASALVPPPPDPAGDGAEPPDADLAVIMEGTVDTVLEWVGDDPHRARTALAAELERGDDARKGVVEPLQALVGTAPPEADDVPDGSIDEVLAWVGDDPERARVALQVEEAGKKRRGLLGDLGDLVAG